MRVHVPPSEPGTVLPMIVNLHPSDSNAEAQSAVSGIDPVADARFFITVAPDGAVRAGGTDDDPTWYWNVPGVPTRGGTYPPADARDDVAYLTSVIDQVGGRECVDPERVYMTGYSGGARMTSAYACARPDKVAAIAPVAGLRAGRPNPDTPQLRRWRRGEVLQDRRRHAFLAGQRRTQQHQGDPGGRADRQLLLPAARAVIRRRA